MLRSLGNVATVSVLRRRPEDAEILRLAVPAFGALVAEPLYVLGDSVVVGRLGAPELAALGIGAAVLTAVVNLCIFLAYGTTGAVARALGAGDLRRAVRLGVDGMWLGGAVGVVLMFAGLVAAPAVVSLFGAEQAVADDATAWLRVVAFALPPLLLVLAATGLLRGLQDTRTPLAVAACASAANLLFSWLFVHPLGVGMVGSAWAMVVAQWGAAGVYVAVVARGARRHGAPLRPDTAGVRAAARAAAPLVLRVAAMRFVLLGSTFVAAGIGTADLAAHTALLAFFGLLALALDAVAIAAQALVGRRLGAGDVAAARATTTRMIEWGVMSGVVFGVGVVVLAPLWAPMFTSDAAVRDATFSAALLLALLTVPAGPVFVMDGVLIGAGDLRVLARQAIATSAVFAVCVAFVIGLDGGLVALWLSLLAWMLARLLLISRRTASDAWMRIGIDAPR